MKRNAEFGLPASSPTMAPPEAQVQGAQIPAERGVHIVRRSEREMKRNAEIELPAPPSVAAFIEYGLPLLRLGNQILQAAALARLCHSCAHRIVKPLDGFDRIEEGVVFHGPGNFLAEVPGLLFVGVRQD